MLYRLPPTNSPIADEPATTPTLFATLENWFTRFAVPANSSEDFVNKFTPVFAFNPLRIKFINFRAIPLGTPNSVSIAPASPKKVSGSAYAFSSYAFCNLSCNFVSKAMSGSKKAKSKVL